MLIVRFLKLFSINTLALLLKWNLMESFNKTVNGMSAIMPFKVSVKSVETRKPRCCVEK